MGHYPDDPANYKDKNPDLKKERSLGDGSPLER